MKSNTYIKTCRKAIWADERFGLLTKIKLYLVFVAVDLVAMVVLLLKKVRLFGSKK